MKNFLKYSIQTLLFAIPLSAIFVSNSLIFPFITTKAFIFRFLVEIAVGLYFALCVVSPEHRPRKSTLSTCIWIFGAIILVADIFSPNPTKAFWSNFERMEGFVSLAHMLLYFLVASSVFKKREDWNKFFFVAASASVYLIFFALLQLSGEIVINQGGARVDGTLGNAAYFAIYLVFQIAILTLLWWRNKGNLKGIAEAVYAGSLGFIAYYLYYIYSPFVDAGTPGKRLCVFALALAILVIVFRYFIQNEKAKRFLAHFLYAVAIVSNISLLYLTATRGAILGFIGGVALASLFFLIFGKENKALRKAGGLIVGIVALIVILFFAGRNLPFVKNDPVLSRFASISWNETKDQARAYVWPMALEGVKEKPILGWGQEGFSYIFNAHYNPLMWRHEPWFDRAHNAFLDWFVAGGILGLLSYFSIFVSAIYLILKKNKVEIFEKGLLLGIFVAYAFNNIFVFDNLFSYLFFFTFLAMLHSETSDAPEKTDTQKNEGADALIGLFLLLSLVGVYFLNIKPLRQNLSLSDSLKVVGIKNGVLVSCRKIDVIKNADGTYQNNCAETIPTLDLFEKAIYQSSVGVNEAREQLLRFSSEINVQAEAPDSVKESIAKKVIEEYEKELKESPLDARDFLSFGSYLGSIGLYDASIEKLKKALALSPKKPQIALELARAYVDKGDNKNAFEIAKVAYEESPLYPEAKIIYSILSLSMQLEDEASKLMGEIADQGIADYRIVSALTTVYGKLKAKDYLNRVLKAAPDNADAKTMLETLSK